MEPAIYPGVRLGQAVRSGSLHQDIPVTRKARTRFQGFENNAASSQSSLPRMMSGLYRGSRGTSDGRENVEYRLRFENDGSVFGTARPSGSCEYEVRGWFDPSANGYLWAETPLGCGYSHIQDADVYCNHVSSLALLNHSRLSASGAIHVEVCLKMVANHSDTVSLVGDYTQSDGKAGDQRLVFIPNDSESSNAGSSAREAAQYSPLNEERYQSNFNPWTMLAVSKKVVQRMMDVEEHLYNQLGSSMPGSQGALIRRLSGRYHGSRNSREGRIDLHYCLQVMPSGGIRGTMLMSGNIFEVVGWFNPRRNTFEWGETPLGTTYANDQNKWYYAAQAASLATLHGTGLVQAWACHVEVALKAVVTDSTCLIGNFASSEWSTGDQRLVFVEAIRDVNPVPRVSGSARWDEIPVVKKARDRMTAYLEHCRNGDFRNTINAPGLSSGKFRGSRGEWYGRVDVEYNLIFLGGGVVTGYTTMDGTRLEVKGWYNAAEQKLEWAETAVGANYKDIEDVDDYCECVARSFLFPQGQPMHVEVSVGLVQVESACLIGTCTLRDGNTGDLRLVYADTNPPFESIHSETLIEQSYSSIDFSQIVCEPLLEKEALM